MSSRVAVVVPSLGRSPVLGEALARLRGELATVAGEMVWVHQGGLSTPELAGLNEQLLTLPGQASFARAVNLGIAATTAPLVAVVNDDALVEPGWLGHLVAALDADVRRAAVQGVVLQLARPERCDGCGIGWDSWGHPVQVARDEPAPPASAFELFGVSATAALYRRQALDRVSRPAATPFDERLGSWYEDVELAVRLRANDWSALCVTSARALHHGSSTGLTMPFARARRVVRNRWLLSARLHGRRFPLAIPALLARDLIELGRAVAGRHAAAAAGVIAGPWSALPLLPSFVHRGPPLVAAAVLERFRVGSPR